jgi:molybdate transport system permease protein
LTPAQRRPVARLLPVLAGLLALYLVAPLVTGLGELRLADWRGVDLGGLLQAGTVSVASATLAALLSSLGGVPLGYMLARRPGRAMALLGFVVQLPLALPPLASGTLLLFLVGYASPIGRLTGGALTDSFPGIVLAETFVAAPFLIIAARSAFAALDPVLADVAATLGHRPWAVFRRVELAIAWRGILAGLLLCWLRAFGEFGATVMVAYHPYSLPVFSYVAFGSQGLPAMLPIMIPTILIAAAVMAASLLAHRTPVTPRAADPLPPATLRPVALPAPLPPQALAMAFRRSLPGFTLDIAWQTRARRLAILGASGSGKSATLRLLAGLDPAEAASFSLGGRELSRLAPQDRGIAYVPQSYGLMPHLPVARQIGFAVGSDPALARQWTERLGLGALQTRLPAELSLGQQQRVALARALARPARLLLLDEPFSALDAPLRARLRAELAALQQDIPATTILVTHDPAEAMLLADEMLLLEAGHVLQSGPVEAIFQRPANETVARLLGAERVGTGEATGPDCLDIGGLVIRITGPALPPGPVGWSVRPEALRVGRAGDLPAMLLQAGDRRLGQRRMRIRLGDAVLDGVADPGCPTQPGPCRASLDSQAVQVWPLSAPPVSRSESRPAAAAPAA